MSDELRRGTDPYLGQRRHLAGLSLVASAAMTAVAAYQNGLIRRLPEPPGAVFDAAHVDASGEAYQFLKTPDASLALISYAVTLALAGTGTADRWRSRPWLPLASRISSSAERARHRRRWRRRTRLSRLDIRRVPLLRKPSVALDLDTYVSVPFGST